MSTYPETIITEALFAHLKAMPGIPTYPSGYLLSGYPAVDWEDGAAFEAPKDSNGAPLPYLRVRDMGLPPEQIDVSGDYIRRSGVLQISVFWALGAGNVPIKELGGRIAERFKLNTRIERDVYSIRISRPPSTPGPMVDPYMPLLHLPIAIQYDVLP